MFKHNGEFCTMMLPVFRLQYGVLLLILVSALGFVACDRGELLPNTPPETRLALDTIAVDDANRLNTVVRLSWFGEDADGYVAYYEISTDGGQSWTNVGTVRDSTFRFDLPAGSDVADIPFRVRAVDNSGAADPTPASLSVPIRNSAPVARLDTLKTIPQTVQSVFSVLFSASDPDGFATIDSIFVRINDGAWYGLDKEATFLTFVPTAPSVAGSQPAQVLRGTAFSALPKNISGLVVGDSNRVYIRARDISGSWSAIDSSTKFMLLRKTSDLLVVRDHANADPEPIYTAALAVAYPQYDSYNLVGNQPAFWETFGLMLRQYDKVFWYSDGAEYSAVGRQMNLEIAAASLQTLLNEGKKLLITTKFPTRFTSAATSTANPYVSAIFDYSPLDSLSTSNGQARIMTDSSAVPTAAFAGNLSPMTAQTTITGATPFYIKNPANVMFTGQLRKLNGWTGPNTLCGYTTYGNGNINQVFWSMEMHKFTKDPADLATFLDYVLTTAFEW